LSHDSPKRNHFAPGSDRAGVSVGPYSIVHDNVVIGAGTTIGSHCEIGHPSALAEGRPLCIGENSLIRSHSVFYEARRSASA
jgi:UDP-3-O-[3-hydroxymyristoyl] glucosamine N-acyltransferase